jgi:hypothetical protein
MDPERALSGQSGIVTGRRARIAARARDLADEAASWLRLVPPRLTRAARGGGRDPVHVYGLYGADQAEAMARAVAELRGSRRPVAFTLGALDEAEPSLADVTAATGMRGGGKFENLNRLLADAPPAGARWVIVIDDDVGLPHGFLDRFLHVAERLGFQLAQPALTHESHAAWPVMRRSRWTVARTTHMVEIGPLTAFEAPVGEALLPFPPLRMGWGLDAHWGALALEHGWRLGVVDATPIAHSSRLTASTYDRAEAVEELRRFLEHRPWIPRETANSVIEKHRDW